MRRRGATGPPSPRDLEGDALRLLKVRERSRKELEGRLARKGHPIEEVERLLDRFVAEGLVDDRRFARLFVEDRLKLRPKSYRILNRELAARGVPAPVRNDVIAGAQEDLPEEALARSLATKARRRFGRNLQGLLRWLLSKGFTRAVARAAIAETAGSDGAAAYDAALEDSLEDVSAETDGGDLDVDVEDEAGR